MKKEYDLRFEGLEGDIEHSLVDHHIKEEERDVLAQVRKEFDIDSRIEIGNEYLQLLVMQGPNYENFVLKQK